MKKAVYRILQSLPTKRWNAQVADVQGNQVIINGGQNVGLERGTIFLVHGAERHITDPATGNIIETIPGPIVGRIEVAEVKPTSARAVLFEGEALRGDRLSTDKQN